MVNIIINWLNYHIVTRISLFKIWIMCLVISPVLMLAMFIQVLLGSKNRAWAVFLSYDKCGSAAIGGDVNLTISEQVGNALILKKRWAKPVAFFIDLLMGKGHCLANASINLPK